MTKTNTEIEELPEVDHRKKHCTKCGEPKFKSEYAWMPRRMQRKARCRDCSGFVYPTIGDPEDNLMSPEETRDELEVILSKELEAAHLIQHKYNSDTYLALTTFVPPLRLSPWNTIVGLPVSTPARVFKQHMLCHFDDDHLLPRIVRDYQIAKDHRAKAMRDKRTATKASKSKGGRSCQHCGEPIDNTAHARKKFCGDTCRKAYARSSHHAP